MYNFLFEGTIQYLISLWTMLFFIIVCLSIFFLTIWVHLKKSRIARKMTELEAIYENLVKSVRFGHVTNDEIKKIVLRQDYSYFQRYLQETISTTEDIDVSAEKEIAEISGFTDYLKKRIERSKKWDKSLAIRVLSYFRDRKNIPLFQKILKEETFPQIVYSHGDETIDLYGGSNFSDQLVESIFFNLRYFINAKYGVILAGGPEYRDSEHYRTTGAISLFMRF